MQTFDQMVKASVENKPEPTEIPQEEVPIEVEQTNRMDTEVSRDRDIKGTVFDPAIHSTDATGRPLKNLTGTFRKKRGRRPGVSQSPDKLKSGEISVGSMQSGRATAEFVFALGTGLGGEEWQPKRDQRTGLNESEFMTMSWARYYETSEHKDLPPWLGVCVAMSIYVLPRLMMPKTKGRIARVIEWYQRRKQQKQAIKAEREAQEQNIADQSNNDRGIYR